MMQILRALPPPYDPRSGSDDSRASQTETKAPPNSGANRARDRFTLISGGNDAENSQAHAKSFRFRVDPEARKRSEDFVTTYQTSGAAPEGESTAAFDDRLRSEAYDGLSEGDPARNAAAFVAALIAQTRLGQGLHYAPHDRASDAYRLAGAKPPYPDPTPRFVSITV